MGSNHIFCNDLQQGLPVAPIFRSSRFPGLSDNLILFSLSLLLMFSFLPSFLQVCADGPSHRPSGRLSALASVFIRYFYVFLSLDLVFLLEFAYPD